MTNIDTEKKKDKHMSITVHPFKLSGVPKKWTYEHTYILSYA